MVITVLTSTEAKGLIAKHRSDPAWVILDVRTPEEFQEEHLPSAVNLDFRDPGFKERLKSLNKEKKYLVHCHSGGKFSRAAAIMDELRFRHVYRVQGNLWEG